MSRLTDKLNYILNVKDDIKTALEIKGIDMTDAVFDEYANKILEGVDPSDYGVHLFLNEEGNPVWKKLNNQFFGKFPSVGSKYESGDRRLYISVSKVGNGTGNIEGTVAHAYNAFYWTGGQTTAQILFTFDEAIIINEIIIEQDRTDLNGTWQLAGSNDNVTFTDIGDTVTFGGVLKRYHSGLATENYYKYYKYTLVSGVTNGGPYIRCFYFFTNRAADFADLFQPSWFGPMAQGSRNLYINVTIPIGTSYRDPNNIIGAYIVSSAFYWANNQSSAQILFTFRYAIVMAGIYVHQDRNGLNGTWQLAGSNDNVTFTNLGTPLTILNYSSLLEFENTVAYKYYTLTLVSGVTNSNPEITYVMFKTAVPLLT